MLRKLFSHSLNKRIANLALATALALHYGAATTPDMPQYIRTLQDENGVAKVPPEWRAP